MKPCHRAALGAAALLAVVSCGALAQPAATAAVQELDVQGGKIRVVTIASGLVHPWSLAFLSDGKTLLVAEAGRIRMIRDGALLPDAVYTVPAGTSKENNDKLSWIAVHPQFAKNKLVYWSHPISGERGTTLAISRGRVDGAKVGKAEQIFVADAWETSGNMGGKILFGPDDKLYVTVGDRDRLCCTGTEDNSLRLKAQDLGNDVGKTLRLNDDGSIPKDNPFVGKPGAKPEIYTYGHRNGYGLAFNPETGVLWQAEIGPMGGDEVNILQPGHNYGWPLVSMGRNYTGSLPSDHPYHQDGMDDPRMFWVPAISPSSLAFYTGDRFPRWKNSMLVGSLTQRNLQRVAFGQPSQAERREPVLRQLELRIRDVQQGPDGFIYVATERTTGGTAADGAVLRLEPGEDATPPAPSGPPASR